VRGLLPVLAPKVGALGEAKRQIIVERLPSAYNTVRTKIAAQIKPKCHVFRVYNSEMQEILTLEIAVPVPLYKTFDYLPPDGYIEQNLRPGMRFTVPFGRTITVGLLIDLKKKPLPSHYKLKTAISCLDSEPTISPQHLRWIKWLSEYYHYPLGETIFTTLPKILKRTNFQASAVETRWFLANEINEEQLSKLKRAPKQIAFVQLLRHTPDGVTRNTLQTHDKNWAGTIQRLVKRGLVIEKSLPVNQAQPPIIDPTRLTNPPLPTLNDAQQSAVDNIINQPHQFHCFLLNGVTGSGKTEVYLRVVEHALKQHKQALIVIPEIGLTPQLVKRFETRFNAPVALMHSNLNETERWQAWQKAKLGHIAILIGTRSAIFTPFKALGLIIVDEEHDSSLKQQDSLRYHARDAVILRAQRLNIPILLGSATPSFESLINVQKKRYTALDLPDRAGLARKPTIDILDLRGQTMTANISATLLNIMGQHLQRQEQVLLFLNRRGYAPTLICHECGWIMDCHRCDSHMTIHKAKGLIRCHHCGYTKTLPKQCPTCSSLDLRGLGSGTEKIEDVLTEHFPEHEVIRIDRDTTQRKNALQTLLEKINTGKSQIIIGTQMLAKGHDFPNVTLVGMLDVDQGLFGTDFRSSEKMAQLITQVAGRAGRGNKAGHVIIQTYHPEHPMLNLLIKEGYGAFSHYALQEREVTALPPFTFAALFRAEAIIEALPIEFLNELKQLLANHLDQFQGSCLGPVPSPIEKRAGKYRAQLLILSDNRQSIHRLLQACIHQIATLALAKRVRWNLDVDPHDML